MTPHEYLTAVLEAQVLDEDGAELKALRQRRDEIESYLKEVFGSSPTIRYGGSQAKGTLIKDSYDLDLVCYFPRDDQDAGGTLRQIFENVKTALEERYVVVPKTSALRVQSRDHLDFHVDVVPGRFIDDKTYDVFLHQRTGEKERLKTNIEKHIKHVRESGVRDAIKLSKLWRARHAVEVKTFVLELAVIDILQGTNVGIDGQLREVLESLRDDAGSVTIADPANPTGNDLSALWSDAVRAGVASTASSTLRTVDALGWEGVFGKLAKKALADVAGGLRQAAHAVAVPSRPWRRG